MKLFGQYLIEKGIISEDDLLSALIEQIRALPSVVEIVYHSQLLSPKQMLSALELQTRENIDFLQSCRKMGVLNSQIEDKIASEVAKRKIPLGEILIKTEKVSFQKIVNALDDYLAQVNEQTEKPKPVTQSPEPTSTDGAIRHEFLQRYGELLSEEKVKAIQSLFDLAVELGSKPVPDPNTFEVFKQIHKGFHEVRGMARFINASKTEALIGSFENAVGNLLLVDVENVSQPSVELLLDLGKTTLEMTVGFKKTLLSESSEEPFFSAMQKPFEKTCQDLESLNQLFVSLRTAPSEELREVA